MPCPNRAYVTHRGYCGQSILGFFLQLPVSSHIDLSCIDMYVCVCPQLQPRRPTSSNNFCRVFLFLYELYSGYYPNSRGLIF